MYRIFIIEDDDKIGAILKSTMEKYGFEAKRAADFKDLLAEFASYDPHLVLLDINLPYFDGFYWCRQIRTRSNVPILFISAREGEMDQVMAIENGGDDYLSKPIHLDLLLAKVKGALRRAYGEYAAASAASAAASAELELKGLRLNLSRNELEWQGERTELTKNERLLAEAFMKRPDEIVAREQLLEALWDDVQFVDDNTLTVNVTRLRKKLEEIGILKAIETVRGQGYRLSAEALQEAKA
ncbi:DNA-binding response OmpR family regulator [Paenibacillus sp. BK033]|uniref:response regulator transcription factor n=1 Tax=Paenibacillus sp. BK033 TaxID=2512133 RepID=UPI0010448677|nr:response regulator transcription factor [Paenibacillus sp. BK033]TCM98016.1 DNA-binding response OmpR family regulator [Paenibacillus sp. BK033]